MTTFFATANADSMLGGSSDDLFRYAAGSSAAGDTISGGLGNDRILIQSTSIDFRTATISSIESLNVSGNVSARFLASQVGNGLASNLFISTDVGGPTATLSLTFDMGTATSLNLSMFVFFLPFDPLPSTATVRINGDNDSETITGGSVADSIYGNGGSDVISGGGGADLLSGGSGDDTLIGGTGNDRLIGGAGNDVSAGGIGADVFDVRTINFTAPLGGWGADQITDFQVGSDRIDLRGTSSSFANINVTAQGADTLIGHGLGSILLVGVASSTVTAGDFIF